MIINVYIQSNETQTNNKLKQIKKRLTNGTFQ
jgi:hypothetical protein